MNKLSNYILPVAAGVIGALGMDAYVSRQNNQTPFVTTVRNDVKEVYENVKDRIETEKAIRAEGIQAKSFMEAKQELERRRFARMCAEVGEPVPVLPENPSREQFIEYGLKVNDIEGKALSKQMQDLRSYFEALKNQQ